jgi:hypothetical protein
VGLWARVVPRYFTGAKGVGAAKRDLLIRTADSSAASFETVLSLRHQIYWRVICSKSLAFSDLS